ncbi:MAG: signal recognition particle-docking protein FtsY [Dissulfurispiraceae bacterium]|jgi:fused signal recognition particle receptor|nr:signal recognition particle-docking protein FtsY [Dissulfurispiraceae bacterium]
MGFFEKLKSGLAKTRDSIVNRIDNAIVNRKIDASALEDIEEILIISDIGAEAASEIIDILRAGVRSGEVQGTAKVKSYIQRTLTEILGSQPVIDTTKEKPFVILVVGVNGVGKTTTIGKLASRFRAEGKSVILAAGDTFRAAAIEQIELWAGRTDSQIIKHQSGSDPAAVAFDAVEAAKARGTDVVIIDTAGRLHTKNHLMEELKKIDRVIKKALPSAPHETLLVLDATTGQNALRQAQIFNEIVGLDSIALTKLDGTAKGGIVVAIKKELGIPVKLIGIGEGVDDLKDFVPQDFVKALFE